jgi:hypothetical protein
MYDDACEEVSGLKFTSATLAYVGAALYWAEGSKDGAMTFANSDPDMIRLYMLWLREVLGVEEAELKCRLSSLYLDNGRTYKEVRRFWSDLTGIPINKFTAPTINTPPKSSKGKRKNKLLYGVLAVRISKPQKYWAKCSALLKRMEKDTEFV